MAECGFCGSKEPVDLLEVWPEERAFLPDFCCEAQQEAWLDLAVHFKPAYWRAFFGDGCGLAVKRVVRDLLTGQLLIDYGLTVDSRITLEEVKAFIAEHHSHNPRLVGWRYGFAVRNGAELVAVAACGRPIARMLPRDWIEVTRVCVKRTWPPALKGFACSKLYRACEREARRRGFSKIITYTRVDEQARALSEVGWAKERLTRAESWHRDKRPRAAADVIRKWRWGLCLTSAKSAKT